MLNGAPHYWVTDIPGHESHSCQYLIIRSMQAFSGMHKEMLRALSCGDRVNLLKIERSGIWWTKINLLVYLLLWYNSCMLYFCFTERLPVLFWKLKTINSLYCPKDMISPPGVSLYIIFYLGMKLYQQNNPSNMCIIFGWMRLLPHKVLPT